MRRVNEAIREVLSDALAEDLKDPRVGFVTVTDVKTSPDLSHARVYVSVLGDDEARERLARRPALRARLPAGARRRRAAHQAHARARASSTTTRPSARSASRAAARRRRADAMSTVEAGDARAGPGRAARGRALLLVTHENPDGDALGSLVAMHGVLRALGKDSRHVHGRRRVPAALRVPLLRPRRPVRPPPDDLDERTVVFLDCGNIDRNPVDAFKGEEAHILNIDHHHDNTRFGTVNHVVEDASCTAEIVWDLMRGLGVELTRRSPRRSTSGS